jgi:hypothetical protein
MPQTVQRVIKTNTRPALDEMKIATDTTTSITKIFQSRNQQLFFRVRLATQLVPTALAQFYIEMLSSLFNIGEGRIALGI